MTEAANDVEILDRYNDGSIRVRCGKYTAECHQGKDDGQWWVYLSKSLPLDSPRRPAVVAAICDFLNGPEEA